MIQTLSSIARMGGEDGRCLDVTVPMKRARGGECGGQGPIFLTIAPLLRLMFRKPRARNRLVAVALME
ncbi:hypothetical protein B5K11_08125 [Rhizobium leguminosarum bv. trifolii]|nr:hypothetical protein B5K11_08125 [Rhizobium leguminosarum bv. trifolii]